MDITFTLHFSFTCNTSVLLQDAAYKNTKSRKIYCKSYYILMSAFSTDDVNYEIKYGEYFGLPLLSNNQ